MIGVLLYSFLQVCGSFFKPPIHTFSACRCHALSQAKCKAMMAKIRGFGVPLTERELAILTISLIRLQLRGRRPFEESIYAQVDSCRRDKTTLFW